MKKDPQETEFTSIGTWSETMFNFQEFLVGNVELLNEQHV